MSTASASPAIWARMNPAGEGNADGYCNGATERQSTVGRFGGDHVQLGASSAPLADLSALYRASFAAAVA